MPQRQLSLDFSEKSMTTFDSMTTPLNQRQSSLDLFKKSTVEAPTFDSMLTTLNPTQHNESWDGYMHNPIDYVERDEEWVLSMCNEI